MLAWSPPPPPRDSSWSVVVVVGGKNGRRRRLYIFQYFSGHALSSSSRHIMPRLEMPLSVVAGLYQKPSQKVVYTALGGRRGISYRSHQRSDVTGSVEKVQCTSLKWRSAYSELARALPFVTKALCSKTTCSASSLTLTISVDV